MTDQSTDQADQAANRPALYSAKWPYPEVTPAELAGLYRAAGAMIAGLGYDAYHRDNYDHGHGIDIGTALEMAAAAYLRVSANVTGINPEDIARTLERETMDLREELETRLAAVLYVLGQQHYRTGIQDLAERVGGWELGHDDIHRHVDAPMALALLEQAAGMFDVIDATDGAEPLTVAPFVNGAQA